MNSVPLSKVTWVGQGYLENHSSSTILATDIALIAECEAIERNSPKLDSGKKPASKTPVHKKNRGSVKHKSLETLSLTTVPNMVKTSHTTLNNATLSKTKQPNPTDLTVTHLPNSRSLTFSVNSVGSNLRSQHILSQGCASATFSGRSPNFRFLRLFR